MTQIVNLPSGARVPLETPTVAALLSRGAATRTLVDLCFAHPEMDARRLTDDDTAFVAEWALLSLHSDPDIVSLARVCRFYGEAPSRRLRISDPVLALRLDAALTPEPQAASQPKPEASEGTKVSFSVDPERNPSE